ncbi:hypothetical protein HF086_006542 [Spodoptera exigua]|uniref:Bicarbonate transporter-like transmembrane domain-containing protein n=1 Tax=Spodoptera exigua TaxID=7107 RepID=A0A922MLM6_SPOEX|nr:hypothetical protein HF086_006542 [Spodoptera exigua]
MLRCGSLTTKVDDQRGCVAGVLRDIKRRYPYYLSDFRDALNGQCVAATIFMYFAALSSAITFGGLLAEKTYGSIGISETLVFTCAGGVLFALAAGQPMMITGATGPLLLLDESLANFCHSNKFDFLTALTSRTELLVCVHRFTEDIFAFLISLIFIGEPVTSLINVFRAHPLGIDYAAAAANVTVIANTTLPGAGNATLAPAAGARMPPQPNTALWCTMLTLSTFIIAYYLRIFRNGKFLGRSVSIDLLGSPFTALLP